MTITYPLIFPADCIANSLTITPRDAVSRNESPASFEDQVYDWDGEMWTIEGTLPLLTGEKAGKMRGFLAKLKGKRGTFLYPIQDAVTPNGAWLDSGGGVLVDGVNARRSHQLNLKGLQANQTAAGKAGDYINLGAGATTRLHMLTDDMDTDAAGKGTANIWPALREDTVDGAAVVTENCQGLFRLPKNYGWQVDTNKMYFFPFGALEVV